MKAITKLFRVHNQRLGMLLGFLVCSSVALAVALAFRGRPYRTFVPIVFIAVVTVVAIWWGHLGGLAGLVCSAAIFACLLFEPIGSLAVSSQSARASLGWMKATANRRTSRPQSQPRSSVHHRQNARRGR